MVDPFTYIGNASMHDLFNELHRRLTDDVDHKRDLDLLNIRVAVDQAHHDYAEYELSLSTKR